MTRKDYILIAAALKAARTDIENKEPADDIDTLRDGIAYAAGEIADALARDNPRFDRERFLKAAEVQS